MPETPSKIHIYDMVTIDTIVFEIVWGGAFKAPPLPRIVRCLKHPGSLGLSPDTIIQPLPLYLLLKAPSPPPGSYRVNM